MVAISSGFLRRACDWLRVTDAGASVVAYADYAAHRDADEPEQARRILASIADYNEYDCLSTLRLRNWLLDLAGRGALATALRDSTAQPAPPGSPAGERYGFRIESGRAGPRGNERFLQVLDRLADIHK